MAYSFLKHFSFSDYAELKVGTHDYFGNTIDVLPIPTIGSGLCYKLELSKETIPINSDLFFTLLMTTYVQGVDQLKGFKLMIASSNTWQGLVYDKWPYKKVPPIFTGELNSLLIAQIELELEESVWNYRNGEDDFDLCMKANETNQCESIFDTSTFQNDTR